MASRTLTINIRIGRVNKHYLAMSNLGGITVRGKRADSETLAVRSLLWELANDNNDDASIALDLAVDGGDIGDIINDFADDTPAIDPVRPGE